MADTIRSKTDFLALVPDNSTRDISAQDLRDCLVSIHGVYGMIYTEGASVGAQTIAAATEEILEFGSNGGVSSGTTETAVSNYIVVGTAGVYAAFTSVSASCDTINTVAEYHLAKNGTSSFGGYTKLVAVGDPQCASAISLFSCAANDQISVNVETDKAVDLTVEDGSLVVVRLA